MVWLVALALTSPKLLSAANDTCTGGGGGQALGTPTDTRCEELPTAEQHHHCAAALSCCTEPLPPAQVSCLEHRLGGASSHPGQAFDRVGQRADGKKVVRQQESADLQPASGAGRQAQADGWRQARRHRAAWGSGCMAAQAVEQSSGIGAAVHTT